jgi:hypothetical protein
MVISVLAVLLVSACGGTKGKAEAEKAVVEFHRKLDSGDFAGIYAAAHADFKTASPEKDFVAILEAVHRKLGNTVSADQVGWRVNTHNFKINVVLNYKMTFAGGDAVESFNYRVDGGSALLLGYNINSQALITK